MQLTVEKLVYGGDGLARLPADEHGPGKAVFVPFVLTGEEIEASLLEQKPGFGRARAEQILQPSRYRVPPPCPYFQRCGGCHYQHASYEHQLEIKADILKENLRRIAKLELPIDLSIRPSPALNYRNRTRLRVQTSEFALGYYKFGSHELLPVEQCPISSPLINRAIGGFWELGRAGKLPAGIQEIEFFANADDSQLLVEAYVASDDDSIARWAGEVRAGFPEIAGVVVFRNAMRAGMQPERLAVSGAEEINYRTARANYRVSAGSFFQTNRHLNREFERVIAVESSPTSHADLLYNSPSNVKAVRATTEQYLNKFGGKLKIDLVVVDPPRSGLGEGVIRGLVALGAPRITYVSCDPATLARDLRALTSGGYRLEKAHLVDLFPQTYHLESVFQLVK